MSISPGEPRATGEELQLAHMRSKVRDLVHERDRLQARAESAESALEHTRAAMGHVLTLSCDHCKGRLTLASAIAPVDGKHAAGIHSAAIAMGWRLGQATLGVLFTTMGRPTPAAIAGPDACPDCMAKVYAAGPLQMNPKVG